MACHSTPFRGSLSSSASSASSENPIRVLNCAGSLGWSRPGASISAVLAVERAQAKLTTSVSAIVSVATDTMVILIFRAVEAGAGAFSSVSEWL